MGPPNGDSWGAIELSLVSPYPGRGDSTASHFARAQRLCLRSPSSARPTLFVPTGLTMGGWSASAAPVSYTSDSETGAIMPVIVDPIGSSRLVNECGSEHASQPGVFGRVERRQLTGAHACQLLVTDLTSVRQPEEAPAGVAKPGRIRQNLTNVVV